MPKAMEVIDISPELLEIIIDTFNTDDEKEMACQIVQCFLDYGLPVKIKQYNQPCMKGTFRIMCFIKKSAEAVIINNKGMGHDGVSVQIRIEDRSILGNLGNISESIRKQILNSSDCGHCSSKCEGKRYVFTYQGSEYVKCHFICNNFIFQNISKNDIASLIGIIDNEIKYMRNARSKQYPRRPQTAT